MINTDDLNNLNPDRVARTAFLVLDSVQQQPPSVRIGAVAAAFLTICDGLKLQPLDVLRPMDNLLSDPLAGRKPQFTAMATYVSKEFSA